MEFPFDNIAQTREESCEEMLLMSYGDRTQCSSSLPSSATSNEVTNNSANSPLHCQVRHCLDLILSQLSAPSGNLRAILIATVPQKEKTPNTFLLGLR